CIDRIKKTQGPLRIADACTGSGCIAVTIAKECQRLSVPASIIAIDLSPEALDIAKQNVELHKVGDRVELMQADLLDAIPQDSCDFVLSNPPYVSEEEYTKLDKSVRNYEPKMALVAGESGTQIIGRLIEQAALKLKTGGWLIFEHSPMNAAKCQEILSQSHTPSGPWSDVRTIKDLSGLARVTLARRP
ncbi:MAG: N5-glutamine methyltransferase family protein, partial [Pirellula sp.]